MLLESMYEWVYADISGVPGIGKTLCVNEILGRIEEEHKD